MSCSVSNYTPDNVDINSSSKTLALGKKHAWCHTRIKISHIFNLVIFTTFKLIIVFSSLLD